jgi:hypothetical protein
VTLHDEVLLEVFDLYRQSLGDQLNSERVWNTKNGWFKLAHVCHNWRSVVLSSPYRLRLRIYFAHNTPTRAAALRPFLHLPIIVDYSHAVNWNGNTLKRLVSALRYPDRVCRIAIKGSYMDPATISKALDLSFPALESLELHNLGSFDPTILLATPFMNSIQSLRHLQLDGTSRFPLLSQVLSATTSLVDLTLSVLTVDCLIDGASIFAHLQRMPHLRNLQVFTRFFSPAGIPPITTTALLAELTYFRFSAGCPQMERFMAGLVAPSLRELHISVFEDESDTLHVPHLSNFIRVTGFVFFAARLTISYYTFKTSLFAHPLSIDGPPSKIVTIKTSSSVRLDNAFSPMLATLEDIFISFSDSIKFDKSSPQNLIHLRRFFKEFRNVKVLRLHHGLETEVVDMLRQPNVDPLPALEEIGPDATAPSSTPTSYNTSQFTSDIFPSLEEIVVYARMPNMSIEEEERAFVLESFGPFATARHQVGRPVKVLLDADGKVPRYFMTDSEHFLDGSKYHGVF